MHSKLFGLSAILAMVFSCACEDTGIVPGNTDGDSDGDGDSDTDTDTDADGDTDSDGDGDSDTDTDTDADGDTDTSEEVCDGLDNDGDDAVDEECPCEDGDTQPCYLAPHEPAEGCSMGAQSCASGVWGDCAGASYPAEGYDDCCVLADPPEHPLLDDFVAAYPSANLPHSLAAFNEFVPELPDYPMQYSNVNVGNEFIDVGVTLDAVETGREKVREAAVALMPSTASIAHEALPDPVIEYFGAASEAQNAMGWAWGSIVYQDTDDAVGEIVFLYAGYNTKASTGGADAGDVEGFYYSVSPVVLCGAPIVD